MTIETIIQNINTSKTTEAYAFGNLWKLDGRHIWNETEQRWVNNWGGISKGADSEEEAKAYFLNCVGELSDEEYRVYKNWQIFVACVLDGDEFPEGTEMQATFSDFRRWDKQNETQY